MRNSRLPVEPLRLYGLPARYVVHTVGPVWQGGTQREPELLASCYRESLDLAAAHGARSIAFPSISTGAFGYPLHAAGNIAVRECREFLVRRSSFDRVLLVAFRAEDARVLRSALGLE